DRPEITVDHGRVRSTVSGQPRCDLLHALARITHEHHPAALTAGAREQDPLLTVLRGEHRTVQPTVDRDPAGPVVVEVAILLAVVLARCLPLLTTDDRVILDHLPEVDPGLIHLDAVGTVRVLQITDA